LQNINSFSPLSLFVLLLLLLWLYSPLLGLGLLGRGISPSQARYLRTEQNKHNMNAQKSMPRVEFEHTITAFKRAKAVNVLGRGKPWKLAIATKPQRNRNFRNVQHVFNADF
jgi:hypothetical protein